MFRMTAQSADQLVHLLDYRLRPGGQQGMILESGCERGKVDEVDQNESLQHPDAFDQVIVYVREKLLSNLLMSKSVILKSIV